MPTSRQTFYDLLSALSENERQSLSDFLRSSDGSKGSAAATEERLLMSLTLAYRRSHTSN